MINWENQIGVPTCKTLNAIAVFRTNYFIKILRTFLMPRHMKLECTPVRHYFTTLFACTVVSFLQTFNLMYTG